MKEDRKFPLLPWAAKNSKNISILFKFCGELKNYQSNTNDLVDII